MRGPRRLLWKRSVEGRPARLAVPSMASGFKGLLGSGRPDRGVSSCRSGGQIVDCASA
jgi:hypothetical protein